MAYPSSSASLAAYSSHRSIASSSATPAKVRELAERRAREAVAGEDRPLALREE